MKNEILKILSVYPGNIFQDDFFDGNTLYLIGERQETIEQLTALMCYREVRAFCIGFSMAEDTAPSFCEIVEHFGSEYSQEVLHQAIDQVKMEMS